MGDAFDFIKRLTKDTSHKNGSFYDHLYGVYKILKDNGLDEEVCLAGLYHSVYGTDGFDPKLDVDPSVIKNLIGERAESLVRLFCTEGRDQIILGNTLSLDKQTQKDLLWMFYANGVEMYGEDDNMKFVKKTINEL